MRFEWDENKNKINITKHGISFRSALQVFFDENRVEVYDDIHSSLEEDRYITVGMINEIYIIATVCYTVRGEDETIRLISAREATRSEKEGYNYGYYKD